MTNVRGVAATAVCSTAWADPAQQQHSLQVHLQKLCKSCAVHMKGWLRAVLSLLLLKVQL
jgi:hypothetical protein